MCGAPAVLNAVLDAAAESVADGRADARARPRPHRRRRRSPADARRSSGPRPSSAGSSSRSTASPRRRRCITINRNRAEYDDLSPSSAPQKLSRAGAPASARTMAVDAEGEILARGNTVMAGYWEQPDQTDAAIRDGFFHTGDGGIIDDDHYVVDLRPQEGRDHLRRRERVVDRGRGRDLPASRRHRGRRDRHPRREVGRAGHGAGRHDAGQRPRPRPT